MVLKVYKYLKLPWISRCFTRTGFKSICLYHNWNSITLLKCFCSYDIFEEYMISKILFFLLVVSMQLYSYFTSRGVSLVFSVSFFRKWRKFPKSHCSIVPRPSFCLWCNTWRIFDHPTRDSQVFRLLSWISLGLKLLLELKINVQSCLFIWWQKNKNFIYADF